MNAVLLSELPKIKVARPSLISGLNPQNLVLVHLSHKNISDSKLFCAHEGNIFKNEKRYARNTLHFTLNSIVRQNRWGGNYHERQCAILIPYGLIDKKQIIGGKYYDFFIRGSIELPKNTVVIYKHPEIPKGQYAYGGDNNLLKFYSSQNILKSISEIFALLKYEFINKFSKSKRQSLFKIFAKENNLEVCDYMKSSYGKGIGVIESIGILKSHKDNWEHKVAGRKVNYQNVFLKILENLDDSKVGFNLKTLKEIIQNSEKPSVATDLVNNKMKIELMCERENKVHNLKLSAESVFLNINAYLCNGLKGLV